MWPNHFSKSYVPLCQLNCQVPIAHCFLRKIRLGFQIEIAATLWIIVQFPCSAKKKTIPIKYSGNRQSSMNNNVIIRKKWSGKIYHVIKYNKAIVEKLVLILSVKLIVHCSSSILFISSKELLSPVAFVDSNVVYEHGVNGGDESDVESSSVA